MSCAVVIKGMFSRPTSSAGGHHQPLSRNINTSKVARIFFHGYPSLVIFVTFGSPDLEFGRPALSHRLTITDTLDIPRPRPGRREARLQTGFCRRTTATGLRDETAFPKVSAMKTQLFTWSHPKTTHARPPDPARLLRRVLLGTLRSLTRIQPVLITLGNIQGTRAPESTRWAALQVFFMLWRVGNGSVPDYRPLSGLGGPVVAKAMPGKRWPYPRLHSPKIR